MVAGMSGPRALLHASFIAYGLLLVYRDAPSAEPAAVVGARRADHGGVVFKSKGASKKKPKPSGGAAGVRNTKMLSFDADDEGEG